MPDLKIICRDCNDEFVFTEGEQKFFASKQFTQPTRCTSCRRKKKEARDRFS